MTPSPYLTTAQLAAYLRYEGKRGQGAAQKFIARNGLRRYWRGRCVLVKQSDVDAVLAGEQATTKEPRMTAQKIRIVAASLLAVLMCATSAAAQFPQPPQPQVPACTVQCPTGPTGPQGPQGPTGPQGPRGPKGDPGVTPTWPKVLFPGHRVDRVMPAGVDVVLTVPRETGIHDLLLYWRGVDATGTTPAVPGTIALVDYNQPRPCYQVLPRGGEGGRIWEHLAVLTARQFHYFDVETGYWCVLEWPTTTPCIPL